MSEHAPNTIAVTADGPLVCQGALTVALANSQQLADDRSLALCRCGASENKPFFDGVHKRIAFVAD